MLVQEFLTRTAARLPDKIALVDGNRRFRYAQIDDWSDRLAIGLVRAGIERGDRVILYLPNSAEAVLMIFAVLKAGAIFVIVNPAVKKDKLAAIAGDCRASAIVTLGSRAGIINQVFARVPSLHTALFHGAPAAPMERGIVLEMRTVIEQHPARIPPYHPDEDALACLIYTSGSSGEAKGVMCSHANIDFVSSAIIQVLQNVEEDVLICALPLSFDYGLYQAFMTIKFGGRLVLERGFLYPAQILQRIAEENVTGFPGVPTMYATLLRMNLKAYNLHSLRYLTNTAAALPATHIAAIRALLPDALLFSMYGLTETKRTLYLPPDQLENRPDSVGIALPGTEVWLEDSAGNRLPNGSMGELVVRGPHVMQGYWNDPALTSARFQDGGTPEQSICRTGDLFRSDAEGYYYFLSRTDDIIKSRGEKISPQEIERVLYALDGIVEAAVTGVPDPILGQAVKAWIVVQDPALDQMAILRHCRERLEDYRVPKYISFCDALPRTDSGKISRKALQ